MRGSHPYVQFITALLKQQKEAKKAEPDTNGRLREIIAVLRKYNYDDGITPEITVNILQDLGPTFVKIGQIASQQAEYLPREYCEALSKLRSSVAPMDIGTVRAQIEKYLGKPVDQLFASFDEKPLGSASVALVIGSCLLCTSSSFAGDNVAAVTIVFRAMGFIGFIVSLFFSQRLFRDMKSKK